LLSDGAALAKNAILATICGKSQLPNFLFFQLSSHVSPESDPIAWILGLVVAFQQAIKMQLPIV
jgi:hypothetical protein